MLVKGFYGECMTCGRKINAVVSRRHVCSTPAGINRKLEAKRRELEVAS